MTVQIEKDKLNYFVKFNGRIVNTEPYRNYEQASAKLGSMIAGMVGPTVDGAYCDYDSFKSEKRKAGITKNVSRRTSRKNSKRY